MDMGQNQGNRSVYFGGVPESVTERDLCDAIRVGPIDNVRVLTEKKCAFVSFVEARSAAMFMNLAAGSDFNVKGKPLKVGWGKPRPLSPELANAVSHFKASRNVYLGNVDDTISEQKLREDFSRFGVIEKCDVLAAKKLAFCHFTNLLAAVRCVDELKDPRSQLSSLGYTNFKSGFGKDRCSQDSRPPRGQHGGQGGGQQQQFGGGSSYGGGGYGGGHGGSHGGSSYASPQRGYQQQRMPPQQQQPYGNAYPGYGQ